MFCLSESLTWWLGYSGLLSLVILALGSGAVLLCRQPAKRLRIIELCLVGCLLTPLLGMVPGYPQLGITLPRGEPAQQQPIAAQIPSEPVAVAVISPPETLQPEASQPIISQPEISQPKIEPQAPQPIAEQTPAAALASSAASVHDLAERPATTIPPAREWHIHSWLAGLYLLGMALGIAWWLLGVVALARIVWTARPASSRCRRLLTEIAGPRGNTINLLTSRLARQPFASLGAMVQLSPRGLTWGRPIIVLPENLCDDEQAVRWALAHEWNHIAQGDFRAWFVAGLTRVLFFYQPLVWWLRRQLRLCQDYMADAQASLQAAQPEDYAEFLAARATAGSLHPAIAGLGMGFTRGKSELYRRVVMLVQNRPLESRPPRRWTITITCFALFFAGILATLSLAKTETSFVQPLSDAVADFNERAMNNDVGATQPPLTEEEVVSAIRGWIRNQTKVDDKTYAIYQNIADTKTLPPGASLDFTTRWTGHNGYDFTVWWIDLCVKTGEHAGYGFRIRDRKISADAIRSAARPSKKTRKPNKPSADADKKNVAPVDPPKTDSPTQKKPRPKITLEGLGFYTSVASDDSPENYEEIDTLIKQKKYKLLKTFNSPNGEKQYIYRFTFPDGQPLNMNFTMPLDDVKSWADYEKKQLAQREQRNEQIAQALTAGRFRLLNLEVMQVHLCRDVDSGEKFKVQRIELPGGKDIALFRADYNLIRSLMKRMSWKQHLKAIRDGKRELLELETVNNYTYEMTADDGTKVIFSYGGTEPLESIVDKPKKSEPITRVRPKKNNSTNGPLEGWSFVATVGSSDSITHTHIQSLLKSHGIECCIGGSRVYGVSVPSKNHAQAIAILKEDLAKHKYNITLHTLDPNGNKKDIKYTIHEEMWRESAPQKKYQDLIGLESYKATTDLGALLRAPEIRKDIATFPYITRIKSLERKYLNQSGKMSSGHVFEIELAVDPDKDIGGKILRFQVLDNGKQILQRGSNEWWHGKPNLVTANKSDKSKMRPSQKTTIRSAKRARGYRYSAAHGEQVVGSRPKGNCSIGGTVLDEDGKPVRRARMYLHYNVTHGSIFVNTDGKGRFEIKDIPPGPFSLSVSITRGYQDTPYNPDDKPGMFPPFSLNDGENRSDIVIKVKKAYSISGRIVSENGKRPKNFNTYTVLAWVESGSGYRTRHGRINQNSGTYTIDGLDGRPVYVMAINWTAARKGNAWPAIYYPSAFSRDEAKQVVFDKSREVEDVDITLREKGGIVLEGTVRDHQGNPVPEAFVVALHPDMSFDYNTAYTDEKGHYRIEGLGPGSLQVHVDAAQRGLVRTRTLLDLDKDTKGKKLDFTLNPGVTISAKLVDEQGNDWHIGTSYAYAWNVDEDRPARTQRQLNEGDFSLTNFQNKHRPKNVDRCHPGTFLQGEGDYDCDQAIFTTTNTLLIQGVMSGHTMIGLSPQKERQRVVKILYRGRDILESGIDTAPGEELKDVTIVVGKE